MKPALVIQTHRLGDVILSFPLIADLLATGAPVMAVASPGFYEELAPFLPGASFLPSTSLPKLAGIEFSSIHNLSSSPEAAIFAGKAKAEKKFGYIRSERGLIVNGFWHLYRAALTQNNRHNTFHWSDLYRLDESFPLIRRTPPSRVKAGSGKIGLFIGASEAAKRPEAPFWTDLIRRLKTRGRAPIILGGAAEKETGEAIARALPFPVLNFAGKTSIAQLANILKSLDLFVTPDTGPMHLANWLGTPVLNLSMGNVNAAETGPGSPGQLVVSAAMSCYGCWQCHRGKVYCKKSFTGAAIAALADETLRGATSPPARGGLRLATMELEPETGALALKKPLTVASELDNFWRAAFLDLAGAKKMDPPASPGLSDALAKGVRLSLKDMLADLALATKFSREPDDNFWRRRPAHSRLFAGFIHMYLQNESYSPSAFRQSLALIERIDGFLAATPARL
ncbi:MAG: glycosyltransferase family 9 protein [Desulfovibrio sp.]|nr:glycosyltransferase family 9 protein [Desulfovibrio sp.]